MGKANFFQVVSGALPEPNTFIGGVGSTHVENEAEYVAATSGLIESDIENFQIDGVDNVSFYIGISYSISGGGFSGASMTYFIDLDEKITAIQSYSFLTSSGLKYLYVPNAQSPQTGAQAVLSNLTALEHVNMEALTSLGTRWIFINASSLKKLYLPNVTSILQANSGRASVYGLSSLERLYIPNLTNFSNTFTESLMAQGFSTFWFKNLNSDCTVYYNSDLGADDRNAFLAFGSPNIEIADEFTINGLNYVGVNGSPATDGEFDCSAGQSYLDRQNNLVTAINTDGRTGTIGSVTAYRYSTFLLVSDVLGVGGNSVTASANNLGGGTANFPATNFDGGDDAHPLIMYLRDVRGCTMVEVSAPITVNAPTSLSYSNLTGTTVDLNFTPGAANANGTEGFEVWIDDGSIYRKLFEFTEITASGDTVDLSDLASLSGVKIKIRTFDGHFNFSEFSNEITLP